MPSSELDLKKHELLDIKEWLYKIKVRSKISIHSDIGLKRNFGTGVSL